MITVPTESRLCKSIHTPAPSDYGEWAEWIALMKQSRTPFQCEGCGQWVIWIPNKYLHNQ